MRLGSIGTAIRMSTLILAALAAFVILEAQSADRNHYFSHLHLQREPIQIKKLPYNRDIVKLSNLQIDLKFSSLTRGTTTIEFSKDRMYML